MQAPRQSDAIGPRVCDPPSLLKQMNLVGKDEKWLVHKALYRFVEGPSNWSFHRPGYGCMDYGYVAVYVDDLLFAVTPEHMDGVVATLRKAWRTNPMCCGFELQWAQGGGLRPSSGKC